MALSVGERRSAPEPLESGKRRQGLWAPRSRLIYNAIKIDRDCNQMPRFTNSDEDARRELGDKLEDGRLVCAHCGQCAVPPNVYIAKAFTQDVVAIATGGQQKQRPAYMLSIAICAVCGEENIFVKRSFFSSDADGGADAGNESHRRVHPTGRATKNFPNTKEDHLKPYRAACATVEISPEASACMSRRCLQGILYAKGYTQKNLSQQIEALLAESDGKKMLPYDLHQCVDVIRNFGNFGAHPITDITTLQIIDVAPGEADWCIEIAEQLMEHYFERPARLAEKHAAATLKLKLAGKPGIKG
jgi:hypothetical protein